MTPEPILDKRELRRKLRVFLSGVTAEDAAEASAKACEILRGQAAWKSARRILFYSALPGEIDLSPLIDEALAVGRTVALPRFVSETGAYDAFQISDRAGDCAAGKFGIYEPGSRCPPVPLKQLDLVLVPGVGFDSLGHRLGRGQGFYDRLLANIHGIKCGVSFEQQLVERIPGEDHDVRMNFILTPNRWLEIPR